MPNVMALDNPYSNTSRTSRRLPMPVYAVALVLAVAANLTTNPLLTGASIFTLLALVQLLWHPGEPPALLFAAGFQWLQVSTLVLVADYQRTPVSTLSFSGHVEAAILLSLLGLIVLAIGIRVAVRRRTGASTKALEQRVNTLSIERVFALYLITAIVALPIPSIAARFLSVAQMLYGIVTLKWIFYLVLGIVTTRRRSKVSYFVTATLLELVTGIGFFAEFKTLLFVAALAILSSHVRFTVRTVALVAFTGLLAFVLGLTWMSVREQYRLILNQGTGKQVILVSPTQRVTSFVDLVGELDPESLGDAVQSTLTRLAYVDYFGATIDYVPSKRGYENGGLLWRALVHMFLPRFIDPDKAVLESDSEITMRYTGLAVASADEGTSIGLGYMAEMYVDFGPAGMFVPIFVLGLLWGAMYAYLASRKAVGPYGQASAAILLLSASQFEISQLKLVGGMVSRFLILAVVLRFILPPIYKMLTRGRGEEARDDRTRGAPLVLA